MLSRRRPARSACARFHRPSEHDDGGCKGCPISDPMPLTRRLQCWRTKPGSPPGQCRVDPERPGPLESLPSNPERVHIRGPSTNRARLGFSALLRLFPHAMIPTTGDIEEKHALAVNCDPVLHPAFRSACRCGDMGDDFNGFLSDMSRKVAVDLADGD
jgi:hypothetical protein